MTLFNRNPLDCNDPGELQQWVAMLQELLYTQREISRLRGDQMDILRQANDEQAEKISLLEQQLTGLKDRLEIYEVHFLVRHHSHIVRQN